MGEALFAAERAHARVFLPLFAHTPETITYFLCFAACVGLS